MTGGDEFSNVLMGPAGGGGENNADKRRRRSIGFKFHEDDERFISFQLPPSESGRSFADHAAWRAWALAAKAAGQTGVFKCTLWQAENQPCRPTEKEGPIVTEAPSVCPDLEMIEINQGPGVLVTSVLQYWGASSLSLLKQDRRQRCPPPKPKPHPRRDKGAKLKFLFYSSCSCKPTVLNKHDWIADSIAAELPCLDGVGCMERVLAEDSRER